MGLYCNIHNTVVSVGKRNGKHKDKVWIKTEGNATVYDMNTDLESWKYTEIVFDKEAKEADGDKEVRKDKLPTGVWSLRNKNLQSEDDEVNNTFITMIPMREHGREDIKKTKENELESWDKNEACREVEYKGQTVLDSNG